MHKVSLIDLLGDSLGLNKITWSRGAKDGRSCQYIFEALHDDTQGLYSKSYWLCIEDCGEGIRGQKSSHRLPIEHGCLVDNFRRLLVPVNGVSMSAEAFKNSEPNVVSFIWPTSRRSRLGRSPGKCLFLSSQPAPFCAMYKPWNSRGLHLIYIFQKF